jgi:hypothetical protein
MVKLCRSGLLAAATEAGPLFGGEALFIEGERWLDGAALFTEGERWSDGEPW